MANRHGDPVWYELLTRAPERAAAFYGALLGWTIRDSDAGRPGYRLLLAGEDMVGGLFPATAEMPVGWLSYTAVGDVDAAAASTAAAGGKVLAGPMDNPAAGRLAVLTDPQGAMFALMSLQDGWESHAFEDSPGHCRWNELTTSDQTAALGFYGALFGWTAGGGMPISPEQGDYRFIQQGETVLGAVMNGDASAPPPAWLFYFGVDDVAAAVARLTAAGGKVRVGPVEVPGGDWIVVASDPEGAAFGLVGPKGGV
ncbi:MULTISPECIES: VOC family protein [unclassified Haematobacter]|uniref:VOC family protein n=1 Tax=unclassified Haematobacter TaxID=2640585 RepID=UPI0025C42DB6|nr:MULTISPECIES: VOC family protein [unclassified Haematobacter]